MRDKSCQRSTHNLTLLFFYDCYLGSGTKSWPKLHDKAGRVTNPFMVSAPFTISFKFEQQQSGDPSFPRNLDLLCSAT